MKASRSEFGQELEIFPSRPGSWEDTSSELPIASSIEILKSNGQILTSYQIISLNSPPLPEIRAEVIEQSRKLPIEVYENDLTEILIHGFYVYLKNKNGVILYVAASRPYSYAIAENLMNQLIKIYEETLMEIFGQQKLPKNIPNNSLTKLDSMNKKISILIKEFTGLGNTKASGVSKKTENFVESLYEINVNLNSRSPLLGKTSKSTDDILKTSGELKADSKKLANWICCKKYLFFFFVFATALIGIKLLYMYL